MPRYKRGGYRRRFKQPPKGARHYRRQCTQVSDEVSESDNHQGLPESSQNQDTEELFDTVSRESSSSGFLGWPVMPFTKTMRVLSLFDGISSGLKALDSLCINVTHYFSFEIDKDAIAVQRKRFFGRIEEMGCATNCTPELLDKIGPIHLLIGGSPCSELSRVNPRRKLFSEGSSGRLFFKYIDVLRCLQEKAAKQRHDFFYLFENTNTLDSSTLTTMTRCFKARPNVVDALSFVPMRRKRFFWHNLGEPKIALESITVPPLEDFLDAGRSSKCSVVPTITTKRACRRKDTLPIVDLDGNDSHVNVNELERLFHLGEGFTDTGSLSICRRQRLIGRSWFIPVITYILNPLCERFSTYNTTISSIK